MHWVRSARAARGPASTSTTGVDRAVDFKLMRAGVITGRVVDEAGDPVTDVQVMPVRSQSSNGERRLFPRDARPAPNDLGEFRIFGLAPGRYYLSAMYRNMMGGDTDDRSGYGPTYYPGTGNMAQAERITIAAGQTIAGTNFTLLPIRTVRVSGIALDAQGRPLGGSFISTMITLDAGDGRRRDAACVRTANSQSLD